MDFQVFKFKDWLFAIPSASFGLVCMGETHCSIFRVITAILRVSELLGFLWYILLNILQQKRKLRIFISNTFYPAKAEGEDGDESVPSWELRVEGRLLEDVSIGYVFWIIWL